MKLTFFNSFNYKVGLAFLLCGSFLHVASCKQREDSTSKGLRDIDRYEISENGLVKIRCRESAIDFCIPFVQYEAIVTTQNFREKICSPDIQQREELDVIFPPQACADSEVSAFKGIAIDLLDKLANNQFFFPIN